MDLIIEFIFSLIFEGSMELANSKKLSKWIRYPIILFVSLYILGVLGIIAFVGISMLMNTNNTMNIIGGIFFLSIDVILVISGIKRFKQEMKNKNNSKEI